MTARAFTSASQPHVDSYYAASSLPQPDHPVLQGELSADVCVVGGGFSGAMLAARLAEAGVASTLIDRSGVFGLGVAYSTGSHGVDCDLIEAHKWFNLAAVAGHEESAWCRADISDEMTARDIAEAQRRAREWLRTGERRAA